ncbi:hypothetical protein ACQP2E_25180 [Actinoplanes sp. CA-015351]|uniref:hypothetical protein n=1 Tax=Actinoplanes sp. CA-015351 TaxID=3239897 RepID=UPI003D95C57F
MQDRVQEAYTRAWRQWGTVSAHPAPDAWIRLVLARLATDRRRRLLDSAPAASSPVSPPPVSPSISAPAAPAIPESVPARALLNGDDGNVGEFTRLDDPHTPPELCEKAAFPGEDLAGVRASVTLLYRSPELSSDYTARRSGWVTRSPFSRPMGTSQRPPT